jgi:hypothetical protein
MASKALSIAAMLVAVCLLASGNNSPGQAARPAATGPRILASWPSPARKGPPYFDDEGVKYPDPWPAVAFVCLPGYASSYDGTLSRATLVLASAPLLGIHSKMIDLLSSARYAEECYAFAGEAAGRWVQFSEDSEPMFVFVDIPGGTAGPRVMVFAHSVSYDWPGSFQSHAYSKLLDVRARKGAYLGDTDEDGYDELVTCTEESNYSGVGPRDFRVFGMQDSELRQVALLSGDQVDSMEAEHRIRSIIPPWEEYPRGP